MKKNFFKALGAVALAGIMTAGLAACNNGNGPEGGGGGSGGSVADRYTGPVSNTFDNEKDPLIFSTLAVDKLFNPFFATSGPDSNIAGLTQIGMIANDENGDLVYGPDEEVVTLDYEERTEGATKDVDLFTTYYFVLKNNVKFSNGSPLTIKDVLFNYYVYLDPVYTGSSTIYSTDIVGLAEYRTQTANESEQEQFMAQFEEAAQQRIDNLVQAATDIFKDHTAGEINDSEAFIKALKEYQEFNTGESYSHLVEDYNKAVELFGEEIDSDWTNALGTYQDTVFINQAGDEVKNLFTTDVEQFLYNEGFITFNKKESKLESSLTNDPAELKTWKEDRAKNYVINANIPENIGEVVTYWQTATELFTYITNQEFSVYNRTHPATYKDISGIKFANRTESVEVNGKTYSVPEYENGAVKEGYNEVLSIKIKNIDPKAKWNFSIGVAPMYYYSDAERIEKFDFIENFGVVRGDSDWMNNVVKSPAKNGVPVGAGAYKASSSDGSVGDNVVPESGKFLYNNVIYFERNPYFVGGAAKIKYVRYRVTDASRVLQDFKAGVTDFAEPNADNDTINELNGRMNEGIGTTSVTTLGYGYIGVNAGKIPSVYVRQAIMHSIDTSQCVKYYGGAAKAIYRPMSTESWAYPEDATAYYPYIGNGKNINGVVPSDLSVVSPTYREFVQAHNLEGGDILTPDLQQAFIKYLLEDKAGYTLNSNGVYTSGTNSCKFTFTIVGAERDHPAYGALLQAGQFLSNNGFSINTTTDANGLAKLNSGALTVWAAAWGSTIDPDMYQVYHKDSKAGSTLNWGYRQILQNAGGRYNYEYGIVNTLSDRIDAARETNDQDERARIYYDCLDLVMQLAVELPTYQRDDLFTYWANKIDISTFYQTPTSFKGLTADLHLISLRQAVTTEVK